MVGNVNFTLRIFLRCVYFFRSCVFNISVEKIDSDEEPADVYNQGRRQFKKKEK